jgi:hypothetical protein
LIFRSIGVPDAVGEKTRMSAATYHLAKAAGLDVAADPNTSDASQRRLEDARRVIEAAIDSIAAGDLDEVIGGFGHRDNEWHATRLIRRLDPHSYGDAKACAAELIRMLQSFVVSHPFEDEAGRPFS